MSAPLRVVHCWAGNLYGGVESVLATLARRRDLAPGLAPEFVLCFEGRLADELRGAGAPVHNLGPVRFSRPWSVWRARRGLARLLAGRPAVVVCHGCWPHRLFGPVARRLGRPLAFWMHDPARGEHWAERGAARVAPDLVLINSEFTAETLPLLFPDAPAELLRCPVEPPPAAGPGDRAALRDALQTPADATVILQASRLERWKGQALLLDALARLRDRPGWIAWIAGGAQRPHEQAYLEELRAQASASGLDGRVRFLGARSDVPRLLAAADIHCQPNTGPEPFGIAFIEALYAGRPVVSTRMGGAAEIVDESCGRLTPPGDVAALASALGDLVDHPGTRRRLGEAGPARARDLCDPGAVLGRLEALLHRIAARTAVPSLAPEPAAP